MKAIEVVKPGELQIVEKENYENPAEDEMIIQIKAAGICGSDLHIYNGSSAFAIYPNIMGHELAGEVVAVGNGVKSVGVGNRAAVNNVISCGTCYACKIGRSNVCRDVKVLGVHVEGGYKEYVKVNQENVYTLPSTIPWDHAALIEPYSIAAQVVERGRLTKDDIVFICGAGPLGLITLQAVKRLGVKVAMLDIVESRLAKAHELGADLVINGKTDAVTDELMEFTGGEGASLIVESTGNIAVLEACVAEYASQAGRIVVLGFPQAKAKISPYDIMRRELDIIGSRLNNNQFPTAISWMKNNEVNPEQIISHSFSYMDVKQAMDMINNDPEEVLKVVLQF